jgi:phosphohistidine phosphatase SixA
LGRSKASPPAREASGRAWRRAVPVILALAWFAISPAWADRDSDRALAALKSGGHYALMRHAKAPGRDDPENFRPGDCATQRNLDAGGRAQAAAIGAGLRRAGITIFKLYASRWCRCMETAELLAVGDVEPLDVLNSFHRTPERERDQTKHLSALVAQPITTPSVLLVTHHDNIVALTRIVTREGEIVVVKPLGRGKFDIVGRILPDALIE